ncbi:purine-binding chemotaxis protein CheW [Pseudobutyrivibrio sp. OR37]|uniref:chemotaxis protein CheW n=1 Tax=Pseudobutyrivibrio sp. OR37 TaxID=1798186 RepID=UPI0008E2D130|nr:chemotaxis protein CheW [Pseudobutyrivibrio sp. OR37]SFI32713.1 purine-binding chemotaxis protein CheW [Pseudobutyrivibrio sp. OR37]
MSNLVVSNSNAGNEKQYIIFKLNEELYGIDIMKINTIIMMPEITDVPLSPDYVEGMISLRGNVIPIINLHKRFNYGDDNITNNSRIIVFNHTEDDQIGIIVDSVNEVTVIADENIELPSPFVKKEDSFISGVGKQDENLISILDVDLLVDEDILAEKIA